MTKKKQQTFWAVFKNGKIVVNKHSAWFAGNDAPYPELWKMKRTAKDAAEEEGYKNFEIRRVRIVEV